MNVSGPRLGLLFAATFSLLLLALGASTALAQEVPEEPQPDASALASPVAWQVGTHFMSRYVFGGPTFSEDPVVQPHVSASWRDFKLTAFSVFYTNANELLEADLYLEYAKPVGRVWFFGAASVYSFKFDNGWQSTFELYGGATLDTFLQPTIEILRDFDIGDGTLVALSTSHGLPVFGTPVTTTLSLVYNGGYYRESSGIGYVELGFEAPLSLGSGVTLSPRILLLGSFDEPEIQSTVYGGVTLAIDF